MRGNNVSAIVFSNMSDGKIRELTESRTMGSVPFGGRYRLIDFPLSNISNSGITNVGIITKSNYQSLMDHLGSGKAWGLSRKREGLHILPPFGSGNDIYHSRVQALAGVMQFMKYADDEYVLLADCDVVANIDYSDMIAKHIAGGADITAAYKRGVMDTKADDMPVFSLNTDRIITDVAVSPEVEGECAYGLNCYLVRREWLIGRVKDAISRNKHNFVFDILAPKIEERKVKGYEVTGYSAVIHSMLQYYNANMDLLRYDVREQLFLNGRPVYTKIRDEMPSRYGLGCQVGNSLVADGCIVDGEVSNSILFRGVKVGKGAKISNSILMQGTVIEEEAVISHAILDKDITVTCGREVSGTKIYPVYIKKGSLV